MSTTWKQYGGQNLLESTNTLTVNSLVTDFLSLRSYYLGDWDICGGLRVKDNATIYRDADICGNLIVGDNLTVIGEFTGINDANFNGNLVVFKDIYALQSIYFDGNGSTLLNAVNNGFGFNKMDPTATIDISSDRVNTVYMQTSTLQNKNVYTQNAAQQGIVLNVDPTSASINMYVDSSMNKGNATPNASLTYNTGGNFTIDVSNIMNVRPRTVFSSRLSDTMNSDLEQIVIYDSCNLRGFNHNYKYDVYNDPLFNTGVAISAISQDNKSNIFMKLTSPNGKGLAVGGGPFEGGIMGSIGLIDSSTNDFSNHMFPGIQIFSGDTDKNLKTAVTINKYRTTKNIDGISNRYAFDVNGPTKMIFQELLMTYDATLAINCVYFEPTSNVGYAIGSPSTTVSPYQQYFLKTLDGGYTWTKYRIVNQFGNPFSDLEFQIINFNVIFPYNSNYILIGGDGGFLYYSTNGGISWSAITFTNGTTDFNINDIYINSNNTHTIIVLNNGYFFDISGAISNTIDLSGTKIYSGIDSIRAVSGNGNIFFMAGEGGISSYNAFTSLTHFFPETENYTFNDIFVFYDGVAYHGVAVGNDGFIQYIHTIDGITGVFATPTQGIGLGNINAVHVFSALNAVLVGDNGLVAFSTDGFITWKIITANEINYMGNGNLLSSLKLTEIYVRSSSDFIISGLYQNYAANVQLGRSKLFNLYAPYYFNRESQFVLEASGSIMMSGDLHINDNGNLYTNSNSISLFPTVATTINMGNTALGGNTFVRHNLDVIGNAIVNQKLIVENYSFLNADVSLSANLYVTGDASLNSRLYVGDDVSLNSRLYVTGDASMNSRLYVGDDVSLNSRLYVVGDTSMNSRLYVGGDASLNSRLYVGSDVSVVGLLRVKGKSQFESDVSINANLFVKDVSAQNLDIRGTTNSAAIGSGAVIVQGGVSIAKTTNIGGNLFINNVLDSIAGTTSLNIGNTHASTINIGVTDSVTQVNIGKSLSGIRGVGMDIYIGDENTDSRVHILGNLIVPGNVIFENQTSLEVQNKTILLNDGGLPGTSMGAGIYIRDNNFDTAGHILINENRAGFIFKATNSSNVVNFNTDTMTLPVGLGKGIITIVPTTNGDGSNFTMARTTVDISDIVLLDASLNNRLMRNNAATLTQVNTQVVDTRVTMTGLNIGKLEATVIANTQMDISGNAIVSHLGIGTASVNNTYAVEISGNTFTNGLILQW